MFDFYTPRNSSLALCECEKDEWKTIQKGVWSSVISPYEHRYVDVKIIGEVPGDFTVSISEGPATFLTESCSIVYLYIHIAHTSGTIAEAFYFFWQSLSSGASFVWHWDLY